MGRPVRRVDGQARRSLHVVGAHRCIVLRGGHRRFRSPTRACSRKQNIISPADAKKIERGLNEIFDEFDRGEFVLRPELEDVHMNVETRLAEKIGPVAGRLHTARSRNDQVATDFRLYVLASTRRASLDLADAAVGADRARGAERRRGHAGLHAHAARAAGAVRAPHARLRRDVRPRPAPLPERDGDDGRTAPRAAARSRAYRTRSIAQSVAEELGFPRVTANSIDAVSDRDFVVDYLSAAALTMVHVSRLAEELVLWSSAEFGFITLPDAFATGSSIMPQKKNPDVAELARGRTGRAIGALVSMLVTLKGLPLTYNRDMQEDKPALLDAEATLLPTLEVMAAMLPRIIVNARRAWPRLRRRTTRSPPTSPTTSRARACRSARRTRPSASWSATPREAASSWPRSPSPSCARVSPLFGEDALEIDVSVVSCFARRSGRHRAASRHAGAQAARKRVDTMIEEASKDADDRRVTGRETIERDQARPIDPHGGLRPARRPDPRGRGRRRRLHPPRRDGRPLRPADHVRSRCSSRPCAASRRCRSTST